MNGKVLEKEDVKNRKAKNKHENQKGERKMSKRGILLIVLVVMLASGNLLTQPSSFIIS